MRVALVLAAALLLPIHAHAQASAEDELRAGLCAYVRDDLAAARRHFARAAEIEPTVERLLLVARVSVQAADFEQVLAKDPKNEEAHLSIGKLLGRGEAAAKGRAYLLARGADESFDRATRARFYRAAAIREFLAAREIILANTVRTRGYSYPPRYRRPRDPAVLARLRAHVKAMLEAADRITALGDGEGHAFRRPALTNALALAEMEAKPQRERNALARQIEEADEAYREALAERYADPADGEPREYEDEAIHRRLLESGRLVRESGPLDVVFGIGVAAAAPPPPPPPPPAPPASVSAPMPPSRPIPGGVGLLDSHGVPLSAEALEARRRERRQIATIVRKGHYSVAMPSPTESLENGDDYRSDTSWSEGVEYSVTSNGESDYGARAMAARTAMEEFEPYARAEITVGDETASEAWTSADAHVLFTAPCDKVRVVWIRSVDRGGRLYTLRVAGRPDDETRAIAFFDSFEPLPFEASATSLPPPSSPRVERVSGGVLRSRAVHMVEAKRPAMAEAAGITGAVVVEVTVDKNGAVVTARAVSGHPLLRDAAVAAAREWRFEPRTSRAGPDRIIGTLTFNFAK
jgi:TonB family protein